MGRGGSECYRVVFVDSLHFVLGGLTQENLGRVHYINRLKEGVGRNDSPHRFCKFFHKSCRREVCD